MENFHNFLHLVAMAAWNEKYAKGMQFVKQIAWDQTWYHHDEYTRFGEEYTDAERMYIQSEMTV